MRTAVKLLVIVAVWVFVAWVAALLASAGAFLIDPGLARWFVYAIPLVLLVWLAVRRPQAVLKTHAMTLDRVSGTGGRINGNARWLVRVAAALVAVYGAWRLGFGQEAEATAWGVLAAGLWLVSRRPQPVVS